MLHNSAIIPESLHCLHNGLSLWQFATETSWKYTCNFVWYGVIWCSSGCIQNCKGIYKIQIESRKIIEFYRSALGQITAWNSFTNNLSRILQALRIIKTLRSPVRLKWNFFYNFFWLFFVGKPLWNPLYTKAFSNEGICLTARYIFLYRVRLVRCLSLCVSAVAMSRPWTRRRHLVISNRASRWQDKVLTLPAHWGRTHLRRLKPSISIGRLKLTGHRSGQQVIGHSIVLRVHFVLPGDAAAVRYVENVAMCIV